MKIWQLFTEEELQHEIDEGFVKEQVHPELPLSILNYTKAAQYHNRWNHVTNHCRGLIYDSNTYEVVARGPKKFMNHSQPGAVEYPLDTKVKATKKLDGSLGIGWYYEGHYGIATRGSFASEQSKHATELINSDAYARERSLIREKLGDSRIYEIVYASNRIVIDYGDLDALMPLGLVDDLSGLIYRRPSLVGGFITLGEAIKLPIPDDEEGFVLDVYDSKGRVIDHLKLKGDRYKQLHALLTNTTGRRIWVQLAARACAPLIMSKEDYKEKDWAFLLRHDPADFMRVDLESDLLADMLEDVPDEFYGWVTKQIADIETEVGDLISDALLWVEKVDGLSGFERWEELRFHPMCKQIIAASDGLGPDRIIMEAWKKAKPAGDETPFKAVDEGVA